MIDAARVARLTSRRTVVWGVDRTDSTMRVARQLSMAAPPDVDLVVASEQRLGRGRHGKTFVSPRGGLYLTRVLPWEGEGATAPRASLAAALACRRALLRSGAPAVEIEWPNDLLWRGCKVGGILAELLTPPGGATRLSLGVGLNVGPLPAGGWPKAGPAGRLPSPAASLEALAAAVSDELARTVGLCGSDDEWEAMRREIVSASSDVGAPGLRFQLPGGRAIEGTGCGIDEEGALILSVADGGGYAVRDGVRVRSEF